MKILYIPLDERPCNYLYPQMIGRLQQEMELVVPPMELLSQKKTPADISKLWNWVNQQAPTCDAGIFSIEMLVYGGLLPSRLHQASVEELTATLNKVKTLKEHHPEFRIYASNLIMRTPHYDSSEEEPDYYADYGERIFNWAWFTDKKEREGLTAEEASKLEQISRELPEEVLADYSERRKKNVAINKQVISLVKEGVIEFLSIPQDDSAPYGFTALDQKEVVGAVISQRLQAKVHMYPGADEVGCTLLARVYTELRKHKPKIYLLFSSVHSETIIPLYEDRPLGESLRSHILAAGAIVVDNAAEADFVLAVNTAGKVMMEAWDNPVKDITYSTFRNLRYFTAQIEALMAQGKKVAVADVAFANGGETELVQLMDDLNLWNKTLAYAGWNTNCNTIGTVLATAIIGLEADSQQEIDFNKIYHLLEGWAYQTAIRMDMVKHYLPSIGASYYDFNNKEKEINLEMESRMRQLWSEMMQHSFRQYQLDQVAVFSPWHRMFEIGINLSIQS
ncbi:DUF4127 family protein [Limibacter armeniacum]|uniref:DUF4127 family protein n=1 Tax=Limibacter armeniacum TaxID=466084 RepID=UPI002FE6382D